MDTVKRTGKAPVDTVYEGFISYSHAADGLLAPRLQSALQRFAKPWWKRRAVRLFRDESSLSANPHLWSSITEALDSSAWFVLLLSPDAAQSPWVNQEIEYWRTRKDPFRILPVVTDGEFSWEGDVAGDAAPDTLRGVFTEEPRWVDLRFARDEDQLDLKNPRFSSAVADITSALRGVPKDELESEEVKQHRRTIRTAWAGVAAIGVLAVAAGVFALQSAANARDAETQRIAAQTEADRAEANAEAEAQARVEAQNNAALAESRELAASAINNLDDDPELSVLLALEAISSVADDEIPIESRVALRQAIYSSHAVDRLEVNDIEPTGIMFADTSFEAGLHVVVDGARVIAYNTTTWEEAWRYQPATGDTLAWVRISPDGSTLAVSVVDSGSDLLPGGEPDREPARVLILDGDGELVETIRYGPCPSVQAGPFSPDGSMLPVATGTTAECEGPDTSDWTMDLVDVETGETRQSLSTYPSPSDFSWSADSNRLLVSSWFGLGTRVIDILSGEIVAEVSDDAFFGSISPDGSLLAYGNFVNESVSIYDTEEGRVVNRLAGAADQVVSTKFSADGSRLIGSTRGTGTFVWDVESGKILKSFPATPPTITSNIDVDAQLLYHTAAAVVTTWDLGDRTAGEFQSKRHGRISNANSFSTFGGIGTIAHVRPDLVITLFDAESGQLLDEKLTVDTFRDAAVLPDGRVVVVPRESATVNGEDLERSGPVSVWNPDTGDMEPIWGCVFLTTDPSECEDAGGKAFRVTRMHTSPDGAAFVISDDAAFVIFDSTTLAVMTEGTLPDRSSLAAFGGDWLAYTGLLSDESGTNASITIVDVGSDEPLMEGAGSHQVEPSHDGALLAIHDGSGRVAIHETESWEEMIVVGVGGSRIRGLAFSPDNSKLMTGGSDGFIRIWNLSNGEELERIPLGAVSDGYWIDDQHIAVDTPEGLWTVVTLDVAELQDLATSRLTRSFTAQECDTYRIDPCPTLEEMRDG